MIRAALAVLVAGSASAQPDMLVLIEPVPTGLGLWRVTADFRTAPPSPIVQLWSDASFVLEAVQDLPITITDYNPSYDTTLGDAVITNNGTGAVSFVGAANDFFGATDSSDPLFVLEFEYLSFFPPQLTLVGQNSATFEQGPFGDVRLYQDVFGNPGELSSQVGIPSPASASLLAFGGLRAARRRRK